jgi:hypothetical protein
VLAPAHPVCKFEVETIGFEPTAPCMPCRCSSRLSYAPRVLQVRTEGVGPSRC